ncbi:hypothetical protein CAEBREN_06565 [Caenorhabditis brenneri]|uniref:Uncharacterized protein n=1 Tax=Caenorhabditis brenneri TaxID=135651 RepID=G0N6Q7_CAEBE|nr:hypothetical protein CAEBREN_06565 [Caenorhabditis brenneri]
MIYFVFRAENLNSTLVYGLSNYKSFYKYPEVFKTCITIFNLLLQLSICLYILYRRKRHFSLVFVPIASVIQCTFSLIVLLILRVFNFNNRVLMFFSMLVECAMDLWMSTSILVVPFMNKLGKQDVKFLNVAVITSSLGFALLSFFHHEAYRTDFPVIGLTSYYYFDKGLFRLQYIIPIVAIITNSMSKDHFWPSVSSQVFKVSFIIILEFSDMEFFSTFYSVKFYLLLLLDCTSQLPEILFSFLSFLKIRKLKNEGDDVATIVRVSGTM